MNLRQLIQPDLVLASPVWFLTPDLMAQHQIRGLVLDVDDTLLGNGDLEVSPEVCQWLDDMRQICQIYLVSNNFNCGRIQAIAKTLYLPYYSRAAKPSRRAVRAALNQMQLLPAQVAMVGDRILTDTLVGNRLGMFTILIKPPQPTQNPTWLSGRTEVVRTWESWLAQKIGVQLTPS